MDDLGQPDDTTENGSVKVLTGIREKLGDGSSKNPLGHPDGFPGAFKLEGRGPRISRSNRFERSVDP